MDGICTNTYGRDSIRTVTSESYIDTGETETGRIGGQAETMDSRE